MILAYSKMCSNSSSTLTISSPFPMQQITKFIQNVNKAPSERRALNRRDEVGIVANSLNQMLDENQKFQEKFLFSQQRILEAELVGTVAFLFLLRQNKALFPLFGTN